MLSYHPSLLILLGIFNQSRHEIWFVKFQRKEITLHLSKLFDMNFLAVGSGIASICECVDVFLLFKVLFVSLQITNWLQCLFIFALVWSVGGTINGDSRKKFDAFFRLLISGTDKDHPKPNNIKMTKVQ